MGFTDSSLEFNPVLPRLYSRKWREAYGQGTDAPRFSSFQAPNGTPLNFVYKSIGFAGGQNVDTAEYPYGYWSNTRLNEKTQTISVNGFLNGEEYIGKRTDFIEALRVPTDDDNPAYLELPLWGRFPVVVTTWKVDEDSDETGRSKISIEFVRAGCADSARFEGMGNSINGTNVDKAVSNLKEAATSSFEKALKKSKDELTLASEIGKITNFLAAIVGRVQGAVSVMNGMTNKINSVTNLVAQRIRSPKVLAQGLISAAFEIVAGVMEIGNAAGETASYFMDDDDDTDSDATNSSSGLTSEQFIERNERNVAMNFLTASNFESDEESITEQQWNTNKAIENLYKTIAFGASAQLLVRMNADSHTYEEMQGLWTLFEKIEESIDKENSDVYAAIEETRIACAQALLSQEYDTEFSRHIRKEMPLLALALQLGCDNERIRKLNAIADSFLIKGDVIYV